MQIELNQEEATVLTNLINIALKAVGLEAAQAALHFKNKIDAASAVEAAPAEGEVLPPLAEAAE